MSELKPLLDGCDDFERALLRSTQRDAPPAGALPKTLASLGLGASAITSATGAGAASAAGSFGIGAVVKALAVGVLVGTALSAVAVTLSDEPQNVVVPMPRAPAAVVAPAPLPPAVAVPAASEASESVAMVPAAAKLNRAPNAGDGTRAARAVAEPEIVAQAPNSVFVSPTPLAPAVAAFAAVSDPARELPTATSIAEEVKTLDRARHALGAGRAREAMNEANTYLARWPNGSLTIEAVIVRTEAELALGDRAGAERDARGVIAAHPGSRYASRVSALFSPPLPSKSE